MKSRTKQSLMKRVNNQGPFTTTCKPFDTGTSSDAIEALQNGLNVAAVFNTRKGQPLPDQYLGAAVIDGQGV